MITIRTQRSVVVYEPIRGGGFLTWSLQPGDYTFTRFREQANFPQQALVMRGWLVLRGTAIGMQGKDIRKMVRKKEAVRIADAPRYDYTM